MDINDAKFSFFSRFVRLTFNKGKTIKRAQYYLDNAVMESMTPYMPHRTGAFIQMTKACSQALAGTGVVCAGAPPMGRMLYYGKVMVDENGKGARPINVDGETIFRYKKGAILHASDRPLTYSNPMATPKWFETAKKKHKTEWVEGVQDVLNGKR